MTFEIDLVPHLDAGDRKTWTEDQDVRPLSELGWRQAAVMTEHLAESKIDALYAGPALRCRETLQPLAERFGLEISVLPGLGEKQAWRLPEGWPVRHGDHATAAFAAGQAIAALGEIRQARVEGRVVACSHGHVIPAVAAHLIAAHGLRDVGELTRRGQWYRLNYEGDLPTIELREIEGFPQA